ncbi:hypothetical protein OIU79_021817 [Salix purpurea]|uniref:Uncharacterized protein n=1 Tax=Salix purpurea TaxID=77065 RepID=A0A9Q0WEC8_SALPP|nr:hypothetical protein OIU79_021817 [Salix purpurea]
MSTIITTTAGNPDKVGVCSLPLFSKTPPLDEDLSFLEEETGVVPHDHGNGHDHYPDPDQFDEELDNEDDIENYSDLNDSELDSYKELEREREKEKSLRKSWRCWLQRSRDGRLQTRG